MNPIEEGIARLENGWCIGDLQDGDKFCAVGAVAKSLLGVDDLSYHEEEAYKVFAKHPASKALAQAVLESDFTNQPIRADWKAHRQYDFERGEYDCVVYAFNDSQDSVEPVLEVFRQGNKIYTQEGTHE